MEQPSAQEIQAQQGTRLNQEVAPWMNYAASLDEKLDSKLEDEVKRYSEHRHEKSSAQNEEELCRWREKNEQTAKEYQWVTPDEYKDAGPRIGRIMHSSELITKLRKDCKLACWYRSHPHPDKATLMVQINSMFPPVLGCWVQLGYVPEFSIMNFDAWGVPMAEKYRGWRTVLLQLIVKNYLTQDAARSAFGEALGPASTRYNQVLYGLRNTLKE